MRVDMNHRRIAFVYAPGPPPESARLETMPFAINTIMRLADADWNVDVFLWERPLVDYHEIFPTTVRFRYEVTPKRIFDGTRPANLRRHQIRLTARFMTCTNYECAFGLGQTGSYLGAVISLASRCPLVLLNDEFPSWYGTATIGTIGAAAAWARLLKLPAAKLPDVLGKYFGNIWWAALERWAAERADAIIVPSADRIPHLAEELGLSDQRTRFVVFRNTPKVSRPLEKRDWHAVLGIPSGQRIFLNAGTLGDWAQVPEIISSTVHWPSDAVLLLHSRTPEQEGGYRQQLSHLHVPGRVFWTSAPLSDKLLNSLVAHCNGSFALYRNTGPNNLWMGTASGKLMRSVMCGSPVIASSFDSLRFVSQEGIGVQVCHPAEIPAAIQELTRNERAYREKCLSFAAREAMREQQSWDALVTALSNKIDLRKATHN
jgi:glycosyltransferase involved in cell wall biosynthesis